jgi:hypothetical protein
MFCTQRCHRVSRRLFRWLLAEGRLEPLLRVALAELQKEEAYKSSVGSDAYASWQRGI